MLADGDSCEGAIGDANQEGSAPIRQPCTGHCVIEHWSLVILHP
jgi:hypothetical protein